MKSLIAAFLLLASCAAVAGDVTCGSNILATPYCFSGTNTPTGACFISTAIVQPTANPTTTMELTDGQYFYVITFTAGTGLVTSQPSCPVKYTTQQ